MTGRGKIRQPERIGTERLNGFGWGDVALWSFATLAVLSAQGAGFYLLSTWQRESELPGAPPPAIMIELAEIAVAPQVEDLAADDGELSLPQEPSLAAEPTPVEEVVDPPPEPVKQPPEPVVEPVREPEPIVEEPVPEPEPTAEPATEEDVLEEVVEEQPEVVEEPAPEPVEEPVPDLTETEVAEAVLPMPANFVFPAPQPENLEALRRQAAQKREQQARQQQAQQQQAVSQQTAPRSVEAEQSQQTAAPEPTQTTRRTPSVSPQQWQSRILSVLNNAKRYPNEARSRREEGVPHLQFTIDRSGQVISSRIVRSSGYPALDQAAIDMVNRASPLPAPPESIPDNKVTLTVPVNFNLR